MSCDSTSLKSIQTPLSLEFIEYLLELIGLSSVREYNSTFKFSKYLLSIFSICLFADSIFKSKQCVAPDLIISSTDSNSTK